MTNLRPSDFREYFKAVHGSWPFPWQERLLATVVELGRWPALLDLPTGTGKTAAIDISLFHLALEAGAPIRRAPLRTVLVVDRRTVVDQAFARANQIQAALTAADKPPILKTVHERLASYSLDGTPLDVALMRGGIARDDSWARSPIQPLIAVSTVDQVGSRLLFRGYGVSDSMKPIHAGLLANDTLLLLDEVHLSEPFRQTLETIARKYRGWARERLPDRWQVVSMSATAATATLVDRFGLGEADRSDPTLKRRLEAAKPAVLREVKVTGDEDTRRHRFADELARAAAPTAETPGAAIGVVVNRIQLAWDVFEILKREHGNDAHVFLLTGRMRPLDRTDVEGTIRKYAGAGRSPRSADGKTSIVVSTQCIEAGADLDFDILVTECASFDALTQRFGRLNRLGETERCTGAILIRSDRTSEDDPIYGKSLAATWAFLRDQGDAVDFQVSRLRSKLSDLDSLIPNLPNAPLLLPAHLDTWIQTSPVPEPDPDVALWLHGPKPPEAEVQLIWRADIDLESLSSADQNEDALEMLLDRLDLCPPSTLETISLPISAVIRWLSDQPVQDIADVNEVPTDDERKSAVISDRPILAWRGDKSVIVFPREKGRERVRPGDTLVVPSSYGGLLHGNWAPASRDVVADVGNRAAFASQRRVVLRLHDEVLCSDLGLHTSLSTDLQPPKPVELEGTDDTYADVIGPWLGSITTYELPSDHWFRKAIESLRRPRQLRIVRIPGDPVVEGQPPSAFRSYYGLLARKKGTPTTEDDTSSFTGVEVSLRKHLEGVGNVARIFAEGSGLPESIVVAIELAGRWHDAGKADPRFQRMLHGGSEFRTEIAPEPLAKSAMPPGDRNARRIARERAGYPQGCRHELMSLGLMLSNPDAWRASEGLDLDLVKHLVASHHGYCRPLPPVTPDPEPVNVQFDALGPVARARSDHRLERLDSGVSETFFTLVERYGWFGLAWLEAILRLADHRRSEQEQDPEREGDVSPSNQGVVS